MHSKKFKWRSILILIFAKGFRFFILDFDFDFAKGFRFLILMLCFVLMTFSARPFTWKTDNTSLRRLYVAWNVEFGCMLRETQRLGNLEKSILPNFLLGHSFCSRLSLTYLRFCEKFVCLFIFKICWWFCYFFWWLWIRCCCCWWIRWMKWLKRLIIK